jgi:hypothetical protein
MEVLEHLETDEGYRLIEALEVIARHQVIISTPIGRHEQRTYDGNVFQTHRHIWTPEEMRKLGYLVRGHGIRSLGGKSGLQSPIPKMVRPFVDLIWVLGGVATYYLLHFAGNMVCVKNLVDEYGDK